LLRVTNNPVITRKVREILEKGINKKVPSRYKIKKDIK